MMSSMIPRMAEANRFRPGMMIALLSLALLAPAVRAEPGSDAGGDSGGEAKKATAPELTVVTFYADWCGTCKALDPKVKAVRGQVQEADKPVLFLSLDLTDEGTKQQAAMLASLLNMSDAWAEHAGRTGFALLVRPKTGEVVGRLAANQDEQAIHDAINAALDKTEEPGSAPRRHAEPGS